VKYELVDSLDAGSNFTSDYQMAAVDNETIRLIASDGIATTIKRAILETNPDNIDFAEALNELNSDNMNSLMDEADALTAELDALPMPMFSSTGEQATEELVSTMQNNFLSMLEESYSGCEKTLSLLTTSQDLMSSLSQPIVALQSIEESVSNLERTGRRFTKFVKLVVPIILKMGSRCPLWPIKAFCTLVQNPCKAIIKLLDKGMTAIRSAKSRVATVLNRRRLNNMNNKINDTVDKVDLPSGAIGQFQELISILIGLAKSGILPLDLVNEFATSTRVKGFFSTLSSNLEKMEGTMQVLSNEVNNVSPFISRMETMVRSIDSKVRFFTPVDKLFRKLEPYANEAIRILSQSLPWWLRYTIAAAMFLVEKASNFLMNPFKPTIIGIFNRLNPMNAIDFNRFDVIAQKIPGDSEINSSLQVVVNYQSSAAFVNIRESFIDFVAMIQRGMYEIVSSLLEQGSNSIDLFEELVGRTSPAWNSMEELLRIMQVEVPESTLGDVLSKIKRESIDSSKAKCDSYLKRSSATYEDSFTSTLNLKTNYELIHCDPSQEQVSERFCYGNDNGTVKNASLMASIAILLHFDKIKVQAENIGLVLPYEEGMQNVVSVTFLPDQIENGHYKVLLYPRIGSNSQAIDVDSRFPVEKKNFSSSSLEELPLNIIKYATEQIHAPVDTIFSDIIKFAMVEKIANYHLNLPAETSSVGTTMHLLSGNHSGICYKKEDGKWRKFVNSQSPYHHSMYDEIGVQNTAETIEDNTMFLKLKRKTLDSEQIELLDSLHRLETVNEYDKDNMEEALAGLSMFVVSTGTNVAYPIIYTDLTPQKNLVYADGASLKPLMKTLESNIENSCVWEDVVTIWEYCVTKEPPSIIDPEPEPPADPDSPVDSEPPVIIELEPQFSLQQGDQFETYYWNSRRVILVVCEATESSVVLYGNEDNGNSYSVQLTNGVNVLSRLLKGELVSSFKFSYSYVMAKYPHPQYPHSLRFQDTDTLLVDNGSTFKRLPKTQMQTLPDLHLSSFNPLDWLINLFYTSGDAEVNEIFRTVLKRKKSTITKMSSGRKLRLHDYVKYNRVVYRVVHVEERMQRVGKQLKKRLFRMDLINVRTNRRAGRMSKTETSGDRVVIRLDSIKRTTPMSEKEILNNLGILRDQGVFFGKSLTESKLREYDTKRRTLQENVNSSPYLSITLANLKKYVNFCKDQFPQHWEICKKRGENKYVSLEDLNEVFIKEQTRELGSGIALNMINPEEQKQAEIFVNVSWKEDIDELINMLATVGETVPIWIAPFALYQTNLNQQLGMGVFHKVVQVVTKMYIIQSTNYDPFSRLWCLSEFSDVLDQFGEITLVHSKTWKSKYTASRKTGVIYSWTDAGTLTKTYTYSSDKKDELLTGNDLKGGNYTLFDKYEFVKSSSGDVQPILRYRAEQVSLLTCNQISFSNLQYLTLLML